MRYDRKTHLGKGILVDPLCALSLVDMDLVVVGRNGNIYFKSVCVSCAQGCSDRRRRTSPVWAESDAGKRAEGELEYFWGRHCW